MSVITVCAGHSNIEPGNTWGHRREADLMRELRHIVALKLRQLGHEVREDGGRNENLPLPRAMELCKDAAVAVELHTNASGNPTAGGVEVIAAAHHAGLARSIAQGIADTLAIPVRRAGGWYDAEQHRKDRQWNAPAGFVRAGGLIVECFFQSNPTELAAYEARKWLVASSIADAINAHVGGAL